MFQTRIAFALLLAVTLASCSNPPTPSSSSERAADEPAGKPGWQPQTVYPACTASGTSETSGVGFQTTEASTKVGEYDVDARRRIDAELTDRAIAFMKIANADGKTGNGHYADVLAEMDHRAGQVLDAIDEIGAREDTIVIWKSDNGPEEINPHPRTSGYWRGTYFTALEGSLRTPFLVRWPGRIPAGAEEEAWVMPPIFTRRIAFEASLQAEPPIPLGTPDLYLPGGR